MVLRSVVTFRHPFQYRSGDVRHQGGREVCTVHSLEAVHNVAGTHTLGIQVENLIIQFGIQCSLNGDIEESLRQLLQVGFRLQVLPYFLARACSCSCSIVSLLATFTHQG